MRKYLYLTRPDWCNAWVNGGVVPLNPASFYRSADRDGIYTPDENVIYDGTHDIRILPGVNIMGKNITLRNVCALGPDGRYAEIKGTAHVARYEIEDGVILSLCNKKSNAIAKRLGKNAAVRINNIDYLKSVLDEQLGVKSIAKSCEYTFHHNRNHFLKSIKDSWQHEFRLFWNHQARVEVELPKGIAERVKILEL